MTAVSIILQKNDFRVFKNLFDFDFSAIEEALGIDCFSQLSDYRAIGKKELMYNKNVSEKIIALSAQPPNRRQMNMHF